MFKTLAATSVALATLSHAKTVVTADGRKTRQEVALSSFEDLCIFENFDDSWCFSATPPMIQGGWEWKQTYTTTPETEAPIKEYY
jgi:hypothetical protein